VRGIGPTPAMGHAMGQLAVGELCRTRCADLTYCVCDGSFQATCLGQTAADSEIEEVAPASSPLVPQIPALPPGDAARGNSRGRAANPRELGAALPPSPHGAAQFPRGGHPGICNTWSPAVSSAAPDQARHAAEPLQAGPPNGGRSISRPLQPRSMQVASSGPCSAASPLPGPGGLPIAYAAVVSRSGEVSRGSPSPLLNMRMPAPWCVANELKHGTMPQSDGRQQWAPMLARDREAPYGMTGFEAVDADEVAAPTGIQARVMSRRPSPAATPDMVLRDIRATPESIAAMVEKAL